MGQRCPNPTYRPHPCIMGKHLYAQFWHPLCRGREIWYNRHRLNVLELSTNMIYTAPSLYSSLVTPISVPEAPSLLLTSVHHPVHHILFLEPPQHLPFLPCKIQNSCNCVPLLQCCIPTKIGIIHVNISVGNPLKLFLVFCCPPH